MIAPADRTSLPRRTPLSRTGSSLLADIPGFTAFAQEVEDALDGSEMRYSQRLRLIKRAEHFGIRRFDANLIIAMVQNRVQRTVTEPSTPRRTHWLPAAVIALLLQGAIAVGAWLVLGPML